MTSQEDITAFLKAKLEDRNPKCATCKHWDNKQPALPKGAVGVCILNTVFRSVDGSSSAATNVIQHWTTDLSVCSAWEKVEIDPENPPLTDEQLSRFKRRNRD